MWLIDFLSLRSCCCCCFWLLAASDRSIFSLGGVRPRGHALRPGERLVPGFRRSAPPTRQLAHPSRSLKKRQSSKRTWWRTVAAAPRRGSRSASNFSLGVWDCVCLSVRPCGTEIISPGLSSLWKRIVVLVFRLKFDSFCTYPSARFNPAYKQEVQSQPQIIVSTPKRQIVKRRAFKPSLYPVVWFEEQSTWASLIYKYSENIPARRIIIIIFFNEGVKCKCDAALKKKNRGERNR